MVERKSVPSLTNTSFIAARSLGYVPSFRVRALRAPE
jgi:hypothetical protein